MKNIEFSELEIQILNRIQNVDKLHPIKSRILCQEFSLPFRDLKQIITKLRESYPIVAKETNGGGYWIAEDNNDIVTYMNMIEARKRGYEETITKMGKFLS